MDKPLSHAELLRIIRDKGSDFEPGTDTDYSNSNVLVLGYIIEKVCKLSYGDALNARIVSRLSLKNTYYGKGISTKDNESTSYKFSDGHWNGVTETNLIIHGGAGAIVSTPSDMVIFMDALFAHILIRKASLDAMKTLVEGYGMGMFPDKYGDKPSYGHNGRIEEFYSALWHFPGENLTIAYCTNGIDYPRSDIMEGVLKICFHEPLSMPFGGASAALSVGLDKYLGKYASEKIEVNCTKEGSKMYLETRGKAFDVERVCEDYYMYAESGYFFEFHPSTGELLIKETDNVYRLKRVN
jgi:D-alanyl-D-alanine carboxypeptidase